MTLFVHTEIAPAGTFRVGMNANNATLVIRSVDGTVSEMINEAKAAGIVQKALEQAGARGVRIVP